MYKFSEKLYRSCYETDFSTFFGVPYRKSLSSSEIFGLPRILQIRISRVCFQVFCIVYLRDRFTRFFNHSGFSLFLKALCSELLEKFKAHLNKVQEKKAPLILRSTTCRNKFGWWIPGDFLIATKSCLRNVST